LNDRLSLIYRSIKFDFVIYMSPPEIFSRGSQDGIWMFIENF